jgi:Tol biopolymer transport system component
MNRMSAIAVVMGLSAAGLAAASAPTGATMSGPNGSIVFGANLGLGFELYAIEPDGTGFRQLTEAYPDDFKPDWSPDGSQITFVTGYETDGEVHGEVMLMNADGSNVRQLTTTGIKDSPGFSPDGRHIVYECVCNPGGIYIMRTDGTHRRRLSANPFPDQGDSDPEVSPDGRTVTFVRHKVEGKLQALFAVDIDGTHPRKLVPYFREVGVKHDWAPDGRHILIGPAADYPDGRSPNVATVRPDGSNLRFLTHHHGGVIGAFPGSYSPDGRWIVFRVENQRRERYDLYKMHADGTHKTLIKGALPFAPRGSDWGSYIG